MQLRPRACTRRTLARGLARLTVLCLAHVAQAGELPTDVVVDRLHTLISVPSVGLPTPHDTRLTLLNGSRWCPPARPGAAGIA
jgi:hypothetical protein